MKRHDVTTRTVEDTRAWVFIAGYTAALPAAVIFFAWTIIQTGSDSGAGGLVMLSAVFGTGLLFLCLLSAAALFKDSIYLREVKHRWEPNWLKYVGVPVGVTIVGAMTTGVVFSGPASMSFGFLIAIIAVWISSAHYIYKRHQLVGVP